MAHGYLGDGYGKNGMRDPDDGRRIDQRGDWRDRDRSRDEDDRGRFMFESRDDDRDRGYFSRTADETRDWFRDDEHDYRPGSQEWRGRAKSRDERFSGPEHGHYLSWRQQQIDALDRDYEDYCRERQQQFHQDFDSWRRNRETGSGSRRESDELELIAAQEMDALPGGTTDTGKARGTGAGAADTATLGTNNSENSHVGRS